MTAREATFSRLLNSNEAPTSIERSAIQQQLDVLGGQRAALLHQLRELEEQERRYRAVVSPLRILPLEVLGEIFALSVSCEDGRIDDHSVVNICLVCKAWREAALLCHSLWCTLRFWDKGGEPSLQNLSRWVGRSGSLPKSLHFSAWHHHRDEPDPSESCRKCAQNLAKILTCGPAIHTLTFNMTLAECCERLFEELHAQRLTSRGPIHRPWDGLDSLTISISEGWGEYLPHFPDLPPVTSFELWLPEMFDTFGSRVECERSPLGLSPQFINRLTRLFICIDWTANHLLSILGQCRSLEELTIHFQAHPLEDPPWNPISQDIIHDGVLLPRVHKLRLEYADVYSLSILPLLRVPNLHRLDIDFSRFDYAIPFDFLEQRHIDDYWLPFAHRHTKVKVIRISDSGDSFPINGSLRSMFAPFPALTSLTFDRVTFDAKSLFADETSTNGGLLLTKLETLELLQVEPDFDIDQVFSFLGAPVRPSSSAPQPVATQPMHACIKNLKLTFLQPTANVKTESNYQYSWKVTSPLVEKGVNVEVGLKYHLHLDRDPS